MSLIAPQPPSGARRYDLDWLRVILFGILVVHHAAVGFAAFGADIYGFANDKLGGDGLSLIIYFNHTWRLPALFLIAGIGTYFATGRAMGPAFMGRRLVRLLVPVVFGFFILNLFAGYAIAVRQGGGPAVEVIRDWWFNPEPRQVLHLWFLVNLSIYTLLSWPLFLLRSRLERLIIHPAWLVVSVMSISTMIAALAKPYGSALAGDGYQFPWYWSIFMAGYVLGAQHRSVLDWAARWWWALLFAGFIGFTTEIGLLGWFISRDLALGEAVASGGWAAHGLWPAYSAPTLTFSIAEGLNAWFFSLTAAGLCARFLNRPGALLDELSRATFPIYVLHFPVTIVLLAFLAVVPWPWGWELLILAVLTYGITAGLYLLADRSGFPLVLIGGRSRGAAVPSRKAEA
ncbi:MAG: acyltransferase family protein [Pseudomonadota bacterium]